MTDHARTVCCLLLACPIHVRNPETALLRDIFAEIDFATAADSRVEGVPDPDVFEFAARQGPHPDHSRSPDNGGSLPNPDAGRQAKAGVFLLSQYAPIGAVGETLVTVCAVSEPAEWVNQLRYLPSLDRHMFPR